MIRIFKGLVLVCFAVTVLVSVAKAGTSCKNDDNRDVDWFFMYKLPKSALNKNKPKASRGGEYLYVDSNTPSSAAYWTLSSKKIYEDGSALANTIAPLTAAKKPKNLTYAVYNDQAEVTKAGSGHTKGLFMFDQQTGLWLIHSVPNFPQSLHKSVYVYPKSGLEFGQVMLCVTFPSTQLETIAEHLRLQHPNIYANASASDLKKKLSLRRLLDRKFSIETPWVRTDTLKDVAGNEYNSFAKHGSYAEDVYSGQVAPSLPSSLLVSTWRNGPGGKVPAHCNGTLTVANVEMLNFTLGLGKSTLMKTSADHSKWAISSDKADPYVCVGTLNRMFSQYRRGGETLCFKNDLLHKLLRSTVTSYDHCPAKRQRE